MLKNFGVWPIGLDKNNLFEEQRYFLMYLMGTIPSGEEWSRNVDYQSQIKKANALTVKDIDISEVDVDVAALQGRSIEDLKRERLKQEKKNKISEIKQAFGVKEEQEEMKINGLPEMDEKDKDPNAKRKELWDLLECRGLLKKAD